PEPPGSRWPEPSSSDAARPGIRPAARRARRTPSRSRGPGRRVGALGPPRRDRRRGPGAGGADAGPLGAHRHARQRAQGARLSPAAGIPTPDHEAPPDQGAQRESDRHDHAGGTAGGRWRSRADLGDADRSRARHWRGGRGPHPPPAPGTSRWTPPPAPLRRGPPPTLSISSQPRYPAGGRPRRSTDRRHADIRTADRRGYRPPPRDIDLYMGRSIVGWPRAG